MIRELVNIADDLKRGREVEPVTVRTFLNWFGAQRRGFQIVDQIREQLGEADLVTIPDFESRWIDANIEFRLCNAVHEFEATSIATGAATLGEPTPEVIDPPIGWVSRDPTYRISKLAAANGGITSIAPDASLSEAVTLMMERDFSQLAVMTGEREVKGVISWMSIGSMLAFGYDGKVVRTLMQPHFEVRADASIFDAIASVVKNGYVLIRDESNKIIGIVTASDLSLQFRTLTEPFLLLSEIENLLRNMIVIDSRQRNSPPPSTQARNTVKLKASRTLRSGSIFDS